MVACVRETLAVKARKHKLSFQKLSEPLRRAEVGNGAAARASRSTETRARLLYKTPIKRLPSLIIPRDLRRGCFCGTSGTEVPHTFHINVYGLHFPATTRICFLISAALYSRYRWMSVLGLELHLGKDDSLDFTHATTYQDASLSARDRDSAAPKRSLAKWICTTAARNTARQ